MPSKVLAGETRLCDKCGLPILSVQDGAMFWNPNPRAYDRNICRNCYEVWQHDRDERRNAWRERHEGMTSAGAAEMMPS